MKETIQKVFVDIFTGIDGKTYHMAKFSWVASSLAIVAVMIHRAWHGQDVDLVSSATAQTAVATGHSAAVLMMKSQEPAP